jgi:CRISPR/Cas system CSM-associated protein Csm2 small subunit
MANIKLMYINRGIILNIFLFLKRVFLFLNKHFYFVLIFTTILKYTNNKIYKSIAWLVKVLIIANIIFGVGYVIYFSISEQSIVNGVSTYGDLIKIYINNLINLWNDLINIDVEDNFIKNAISNNDEIIKMKNDLSISIKSGVKEALKEVVDEALDKIREDEIHNYNISIIKNVCFVSGILFIGYFTFILPGSNITPDELTQFNWFNQSMIEFKLQIINYFSNPTNPGNTDGSTATDGLNQISPSNSSNLSVTPKATSTFLDQASEWNKYSNPLTMDAPTQTDIITKITNASTQTDLNGMSVGKLQEFSLIMKHSLEQVDQDNIRDAIHKTVKTITD